MEDKWTLSSSGLVVPRKPKPVAVDLFCGAGGMSLGIKQAGFHVVAAMDNDVSATLTYTVNLGAQPMKFHFAAPEDEERLEKALVEGIEERFKSGKMDMMTTGSGWISHHPDVMGVGHFFFGDIRKFTGKQILDAVGFEPGEIDLVCGGPPCQGFSAAGKRDVMDPRNSLIFEFARMVLEIQPKTICMENVPGIMSMVTPEGIPVIEAFCRVLEDGGFAGFDAMKRTLEATAGVGAIFSRKRKGKEPVLENAQEEGDQLPLFS